MFNCILDPRVHSFPARARGYVHPLSFICHFDRLKMSVVVSVNTPVQPGNRIPTEEDCPLSYPTSVQWEHIFYSELQLHHKKLISNQCSTNKKTFLGQKYNLIQSPAFGNSSVNYKDYENRVSINQNTAIPSQTQECSLCPLK